MGQRCNHDYEWKREKGRDQWDKKHLKQSQNPSILQTLATSTLIHSFANLKDKTIAYIIIFIIHTINHGLGAYLDRSSKFEEEWGNLFAVLEAGRWTGRAHPWTGRAQLNGSRPLCFCTAGGCWTGRAPPNRSRTSLDGSRTCKLPETLIFSPSSPCTLSQSLLEARNAQWELKEGELPFIISLLKKKSSKTHFIKSIWSLFKNTDFLGFLYPEIDFLSALTWFFLQGDHLKDCGKGTRVVAAFLKTFWKFILFTKIIMTLALKTGFLNPRLKMFYTWWKFQRNMFTILPLACWSLKDFQRHDLAKTTDQNPRPRILTLRPNKSSLTNSMTDMTWSSKAKRGMNRPAPPSGLWHA